MTKRKMFLEILAIALVFGMTVAGCNDDSTNNEDEDKGITIGNWKWTVYDDSSNNGTSKITMKQGTGADSNKLTFTGNVTNVYEYGYAGFRPIPNDAELAKLKTASSISFKAKGSGTYRFMVRTSDITDYSDYQKYITPTSTESTITIYFNDLNGPGWGQSQTKPFIQNNIEMILFEYSINYPGGGPGPFNLTISDLKLDNDDNDSNGNGNGDDGGSNVSGDGDTLTLSGQVYIATQTNDPTTHLVTNISTTQLTSGTITLSDELSCGSGSIQNGQLSYTLGKPTSAQIKQSISTIFSSDDYTNIVVSPSNANDAKFAVVENLENKNNNQYSPYIMRADLTINSIGNYKSVGVVYVYFDKACTITATGKTYTDPDDGVVYTTKNVNLNLNKGWNVLYGIEEEKYNSTTGAKISFTDSYYNGDYSSAKWLIGSK